MKAIAAVVALALLLAPPSAFAQDEISPNLVEGLVIQARAPGPAWWKITRGDSTVWILGTPPYLSAGYQWDKRALRRRLDGARAFVTPLYMLPQPVTPGNRDRNGAEGDRIGDLDSATLERLRGAFLSYRIVDLSNTASQVFAARHLNTGMFRTARLNTTELRIQLEAEARRARVQIRRTVRNTSQAATAYVKGDPGPKRACLLATLQVAELGVNALGDGLDAWARGDLPRSLATAGCVGAKTSIYREEARSVSASVLRELAQPGKIVMAVELIPLLMEGGVIERLKAAGVTIEGPDRLELEAEA